MTVADGARYPDSWRRERQNQTGCVVRKYLVVESSLHELPRTMFIAADTNRLGFGRVQELW